jgi:hypothetical protein
MLRLKNVNRMVRTSSLKRSKGGRRKEAFNYLTEDYPQGQELVQRI